jgi:hypothetical protein
MMGLASANRSPVVELPPRSDRLFRIFRWYARRYCARNLHAIRLAHWGPAPKFDCPAVVVMNHPSWWDPLLAYVLTYQFKNRVDWGVIEAAGLRQYRFLGRAGLFGVEGGSPRGALRFLETAQAVLADSRATIWVAAQGRFADVRERPISLRSGVGHIAQRQYSAVIAPLALEVTYWDQRTPEALAAFGPLMTCADHRDWSPIDWTTAIERALEDTQNKLAADAISRDPNRFEVLVRGRAGVGGVYDVWRRMATWLRGEPYSAEHRSD